MIKKEGVGIGQDVKPKIYSTTLEHFALSHMRTNVYHKIKNAQSEKCFPVTLTLGAILMLKSSQLKGVALANARLRMILKYILKLANKWRITDAMIQRNREHEINLAEKKIACIMEHLFPS